MAHKRYLLVEGVLDKNGVGVPVTNPHASAARHGDTVRFVGFRVLATPPTDPDHLIEHFEPVPELVVDHPDLRSAIRAKDLRLVSECVAKTHEEARRSLSGKDEA